MALPMASSPRHKRAAADVSPDSGKSSGAPVVFGAQALDWSLHAQVPCCGSCGLPSQSGGWQVLRAGILLLTLLL